MNPVRMYEIFLEALQNENIKQEIKTLISAKLEEDRIEGQTELFPRSNTEELEAENMSLMWNAALLELEISRVETEREELLSQLNRARDSLNEYCTAYGAQISLYEKYKRLSDPVRKVMKGIFKNNSLSGFFLCGVQLENIRSLRDYTEQLVINNYDKSKEDIIILNELYTYFLSCYNSTFTKPVYALGDTAEGDCFDSERHHNIGTAREGRITKVLLQGCICTGNGKILRKAIVKI